MAKYEISETKFVNPYNFVPVNLKSHQRKDIQDIYEKEEPLLTGYLQCRMICRTPLAIPDVAKRDDKDGMRHYKYPFFSVKAGQPIIPGSEIRGVVRNVYETITDSCFGTMQKDTVITGRTKKPFLPGVLIKEGEQWKLYHANKYLVVTENESFLRKQGLNPNKVQLYKQRDLEGRNSELVYFIPVCSEDGKEVTYKKRNYEVGAYVKEISDIFKPGFKSGYLCIGEKAPKRHFQGIFEINSNKKEINIEEKDFIKLETVLKTYRDAKINSGYGTIHKGYKNYEEEKRKGVIPVYFQYLDGKLYMSFAALGRKAFYRTINDMAMEKSHQKCIGRNNFCPACALFGTIEGEKLGSRVRFTDAECVNFTDDLFDPNVVFQELASPKKSYFPFYLTGKTDRYSMGYDAEGLRIRGRKFYWHHRPCIQKVGNIPQNQRNATFEVLGKGEKMPIFEFKIYFDGIIENQLKLLATAIHLNENQEDGKLCHKIGHGKPLGYGSVKMIVQKCVCRKFSLESGWNENVWEDIFCNEDDLPCGNDTFKALKKISNFHACDRFTVEYPGIEFSDEKDVDKNRLDEKVLANYKWFSQNYSLGSNSLCKTLPEITDEDITLQKYVAKDFTGKDFK